MLIFLRQKCKIDLQIFTFFISVLQLSVLSIQSFNFQFLSMQDSVKPQLWAVVDVTERMLFLFLFFINYGIKRKKKSEKKKKKTFSSSSSSILDSSSSLKPSKLSSKSSSTSTTRFKNLLLEVGFFLISPEIVCCESPRPNRQYEQIQ